MKPYFLVAYNHIKLSGKKLLHCRRMRWGKVLLLGRNTKLCVTDTSEVTLGDHIVSDGRLVMMVGPQAKLRIGDGVYFNENMMISCKSSVTIGQGCKFGPNVSIFDNNHRFDAQNGVSNEHTTAPVSIGEHCWIGAGAVILKGVTIGKNCVIGAGCVVTQDIPACSRVTQSRELHIQPLQK